MTHVTTVQWLKPPRVIYWLIELITLRDWQVCGEELAFLIVQDFKHPELRVQINDSWPGISFNLHPSKLATNIQVCHVRNQSWLAPVWSYTVRTNWSRDTLNSVHSKEVPKLASGWTLVAESFVGVKCECELFFLFLFSRFSISANMDYTSSLQNYNNLLLTLCVFVLFLWNFFAIRKNEFGVKFPSFISFHLYFLAV